MSDVSASWVPLPHVTLGGQRMTIASQKDLADAMAADCIAARALSRNTPRLIFDANGHGISLRQTSSDYRNAMNAADVVHADGGFLVTASRWLAPQRIAERSATTDLFHVFADRAQREGLSFYLLGGTEEINAACASRLRELYPHLSIAGRQHGYFEDEASIVADINAARPDIVWVGLGKPREQAFAVRNRSRLRAGWLVTCGGCYNYVVGAYQRAPVWMQRANLEWLHRMLTRPRELLWRYLVTTPHALWLVLSTPRTS